MDTNITTLPVMADAMTAAELSIRCKALVGLVCPKTRAHVSISSDYGLSVSVDVPGQPGKFFWADTLSEAFSAAEIWAATQALVRRDSIIRKMALAIIDLTDSGNCTAQMLRARDFSQAEIDEFHEAACNRASEMCASGRFVVIMDGVAS